MNNGTIERIHNVMIAKFHVRLPPVGPAALRVEKRGVHDLLGIDSHAERGVHPAALNGEQPKSYRIA